MNDNNEKNICNSEFADRVISEIQGKCIEPQARWRCEIRNTVFWFAILVMTGVGAMAIATMIYMEVDYDWDVFSFLGMSFWRHSLYAVPYLWLAAFAGMTALTIATLRQTKRGYQYSRVLVLGGSVAASFILGVAMFLGGFDSEIHDVLRVKVPTYNHFVRTNDDVWMNPDRGLLSGEISLVDGDGLFITDASGMIWQIRTVTTTIYQGNPVLEHGNRLKLVGLREGPDSFYAAIVRPWSCCNAEFAGTYKAVQ